MSLLLSFGRPLVQARFVRRHKRFLVEVDGPDGLFWAHTNNTGSMLGLLRPGRPVLLSVSASPTRKLPHTLEMAGLPHRGGVLWAGVNTMVPNRLLRAAVAAGVLAGVLPETRGLDRFEAEPRFAEGRLDARLTGPAGTLWVETKNVSLVEDGAALFPDAVTQRGQKHLVELMRLVRAGERAACLFVVQRAEARCFGPAECIDPEYARLFWEARAAGVMMWAVRAEVGPQGVGLGERLPLARE